MKSRTSFFNRAVIKKDITRFAPLWVLYTLGVLLIMLSAVSSSAYIHPVHNLNTSVAGMATANLFYAVLVAQLLFGDLFKSKMCNALHAMPVSRNAWFGSHLLVGLGFSLIPNLLTSLLMMFSLGKFWYTALLWLGAVTLQYLFFFGVAVLSVLLTGNRFAAVMIYAIINFLGVMAAWFADMVYSPLMPGVVLNMQNFLVISPVVNMAELNDLFKTDWFYERGGRDTWQNAKFTGLGEGWYYLWICAAIGAAVLVVSLLLYRRRAMEKAGDFIVVKALRPVFLTLYTLCAGAFLSIFGDLFYGGGHVVFLLLGFVVGFFTGKMLLERSTKVFQKKSFLQLGILLVVMLATLGMAKWDVFGVVRYVPAAEEVSYVTVSNSFIELYRNRKIYDEEEIAYVIEAHQAILDDDCDGDCNQSHRYCTITYHLKSGRTVERQYHYCSAGGADKWWKKIP